MVYRRRKIAKLRAPSDKHEYKLSKIKIKCCFWRCMLPLLLRWRLLLLFASKMRVDRNWQRLLPFFFSSIFQLFFFFRSRQTKSRKWLGKMAADLRLTVFVSTKFLKEKFKWPECNMRCKDMLHRTQTRLVYRNGKVLETQYSNSSLFIFTRIIIITSFAVSTSPLFAYSAFFHDLWGERIKYEFFVVVVALPSIQPA